MCLVVGDSLLVVDAAVQGDVDAEGSRVPCGESKPYNRSRMSWRRRLWVETILRLTPVVLGEGTLDDRPDESAAPANPPLNGCIVGRICDAHRCG